MQAHTFTSNDGMKPLIIAEDGFCAASHILALPDLNKAIFN